MCMICDIWSNTTSCFLDTPVHSGVILTVSLCCGHAALCWPSVNVWSMESTEDSLQCLAEEGKDSEKYEILNIYIVHVDCDNLDLYNYY